MSTDTKTDPNPLNHQATNWTMQSLLRAAELVTGKFAAPLLAASGLPPKDSVESVILFDNASGTGVVASVLLGMLDEQEKPRVKILCGDTNEGMIKHVKDLKEKENWENLEAEVIDAHDTKLPSSTYTHVLTGFGLMLFPKPSEAMKEIYRVLLPGGVNGFTTWQTVGWIPWVQSAFEAIPGCPPFPDAEERLNFNGTGRWDRQEFLKEEVAKYGFEDVKVETCTQSPRMDSPEMFVSMFANQFIAFTTRKFTDEEKKEFGPKVKEIMLKQLQEKYGEGKPFDMEMVANIVTCRKPAAA